MLPKSFRYRTTILEDGATMQGSTCLRFSHISAHLLHTYRCKVRPKVRSVTKISVQPKTIIKAGTWILIMCWIKGLIMCKSLLFHELKQEDTTSFVWKNFLKQEVPPWKGLCNQKKKEGITLMPNTFINTWQAHKDIDLEKKSNITIPHIHILFYMVIILN